MQKQPVQHDQQARAFEAKYAAMAKAINKQAEAASLGGGDFSAINASTESRFYYWQVVRGHCAKIVKKLAAQGLDTAQWKSAMADAQRRQENDTPAARDDFWFFFLDDGVSEHVID